MTAPAGNLPAETAVAHHDARQEFTDGAALVAGQMWSEVDPDRLVESWVTQVPELTAVVTGAQLGAARQADPYTSQALRDQALDESTEASVNPEGFAGHTADGGALMSLLTNPIFITLATIADGVDVAQALTRGRTRLESVVRTEVADAGRLADQSSLIAHRGADGYVRVTDGNPCARCLLLAGKTYRWNRGFLRHPRCGCMHVPTLLAHPRWRDMDPRDFYDSLTPHQRTLAGFTQAQQKALAAGADLNQVVNAQRGIYVAGGRRLTREGATRRGLFGGFDIGPGGIIRRRPVGTRALPERLTPYQIFREATSQEQAVELLIRNRYLIADVPRAVVTRDAALLGRMAPRQALVDARTVQEVSEALVREYARITGRVLDVRLTGSAATAREHAEGILRVAERFPATPLRTIRNGDAQGYYAVTNRSDIVFSDDWSATNARRDYLGAVQADMRSGWHPPRTNTPASVAIHEAAHSLPYDVQAMTRLVDGRAREISAYAMRDLDEAVAEAVVDVLVNGPDAALLSRQVVEILDRGVLPLSARRVALQQDFAARRALVERDFTARRAQLRAQAAAREQIRQTRAAERAALRELRADEAAARRALAEQGRIARRQAAISQRLMPSAQGPAGMSVTQLRARVKDAGITVPTGLRRPDLERLVAVLESGLPPAAARARAAAAVVGERRAVAEALQEAAELAANGASARALRSVASRMRTTLGPDAAKIARELLDAMDAGDIARVQAAIPVVARGAKLRQVGGDVGTVARLDRSVMGEIGEGRAATAVTRTGREALEAPPIWVSQRSMSFGGPVDVRGLDGFTAAQRERILSAIESYRGLGYQGVNRYLRTGEPVRGARSVVAEIDRAMAQSRLPDNAILWRGIPSGERTFGGNVARDLTGYEWTDAAYVSTSTAREIAERGGSVLMRVVTPQGTGAIRLSDFEAEVLLERGLAFRVVRDNGLVDGRRFLDVEIVPARAVEADAVRVVRPGWATTFERQNVVLSRAAVVRSETPLPVKATKAPAKKAAVPVAAGPDLTGVRRGLSSDPAVRRVQLDNRVREAYREIIAAGTVQRVGATEYVGMVDLRSHRLLRDLSRADQDAAIAGIIRFGDVLDAGGRPVINLIPVANRKALTKADWDAQVFVGGEGQDAIAFANPALRPLPAAPTKATKATVAKKAPAPKPPTPPERMTAPALKAELQRYGAPADLLTGVPPKQLQVWVRRSREIPPAERQAEVGRWRQRRIDQSRKLADALVETDEIIGSFAPTAGTQARALSARQAEVLLQRIEARARRIGDDLTSWPEGVELLKLLTAIRTGNPARIRTAIAGAQRKLGLRQVGDNAGSLARYDRTSMTSIGDQIPDGAQVVVVRPGYTVQIGGETVTLSRPVVQQATARDVAGGGTIGPKASALPRVADPGDVRAQAMGANPRYGQAYEGAFTPRLERAGGASYTQNCTRTVLAYEMRRRGIRVTAGAATPVGDTTAAYVRTFRANGRYATRVMDDLSRNMSAREVATEVEGWPRGARGIVTIKGHTLNVERDAVTGKAVFIDTQAAQQKQPIMNLTQFLARVRSRGVPTDRWMAVARVDDLDLSDYGLRYVESPELDINDGSVYKAEYPQDPDSPTFSTSEEIAAMRPDDSYP